MVLCREQHAKAIDKLVAHQQGGPLIRWRPRPCLQEASTASFRRYAQQVVANAAVLAGLLMEAGHRRSHPAAPTIAVLIDVRLLTGKEAEAILGRAMQ